MCNQISGWFLKPGVPITPHMQEMGVVPVPMDGNAPGYLILQPRLTNSHTTLARMYNMDEDSNDRVRFEYTPNLSFDAKARHNILGYPTPDQFTDMIFNLDNWDFHWDLDHLGFQESDLHWCNNYTNTIRDAVRRWVADRQFTNNMRIPYSCALGGWFMVRDCNVSNVVRNSYIFRVHNTRFSAVVQSTFNVENPDTKLQCEIDEAISVSMYSDDYCYWPLPNVSQYGEYNYGNPFTEPDPTA